VDLNRPGSVVDPDLELRKGSGFVLLAFAAFSFVHFFFIQKKGLPRSAFGNRFNNANISENH